MDILAPTIQLPLEDPNTTLAAEDNLPETQWTPQPPQISPLDQWLLKLILLLYLAGTMLLLARGMKKAWAARTPTQRVTSLAKTVLLVAVSPLMLLALMASCMSAHSTWPLEATCNCLHWAWTTADPEEETEDPETKGERGSHRK